VLFRSPRAISPPKETYTGYPRAISPPNGYGPGNGPGHTGPIAPSLSDSFFNGNAPSSNSSSGQHHSTSPRERFENTAPPSANIMRQPQPQPREGMGGRMVELPLDALLNLCDAFDIKPKGESEKNTILSRILFAFRAREEKFRENVRTLQEHCDISFREKHDLQKQCANLHQQLKQQQQHRPMPLNGSIKLYNCSTSEMRRFPVDFDSVTYDHLLDTTCSVFPSLSAQKGPIFFAYKDEDGDRILVSTNEEFRFAVQVLTAQNPNVIKFELA